LGANKNIVLRGYFDRYHYQGAYPYDILSFDESFSNWLGSEFRFWWDFTVNNRLTIGVEYQTHLRANYRLWDTDAIYFDDNFPFNLFSLYLQDEFQLLTNLSLNFGLHLDRYSTVGSSFTPRAAIVYNPIKSATLKFLYGRAFRAPNVYEANYEDPLFGHKINPDIKPEKIRTCEIVWEQRLSNELFGVISFYDYGMKDLIDQIMDESDSLTQFQNVGKVSARGLEFELQTLLKNGLRGYVNYAFADAKDADLMEKLTNSPSHLAKLGLIYPFLKYFYAAAELQYETGRNTVQGTKTDPYFFTNINLSTRRLFNHLRISVLVRNLFNVKYKLPCGFEHRQPAIAQNGRNFGVKLEFKF
jgi:iron complex outermembrane receptor protein